MDSYDLELAFYQRLIALTYTNLETVRPDEIMDPATVAKNIAWRRGFVIRGNPETVAFGNGVYSRMEGIYQIDIWVPRVNYDALGDGSGALKQLKKMSDGHVTQFFPANGRGLALTKNSTTANIIRQPKQRYIGREGAFLREIVEVDFYAEINPSA